MYVLKYSHTQNIIPPVEVYDKRADRDHFIDYINLLLKRALYEEIANYFQISKL